MPEQNNQTVSVPKYHQITMNNLQKIKDKMTKLQ